MTSEHDTTKMTEKILRIRHLPERSPASAALTRLDRESHVVTKMFFIFKQIAAEAAPTFYAKCTFQLYGALSQHAIPDMALVPLQRINCDLSYAQLLQRVCTKIECMAIHQFTAYRRPGEIQFPRWPCMIPVCLALRYPDVGGICINGVLKTDSYQASHKERIAMQYLTRPEPGTSLPYKEEIHIIRGPCVPSTMDQGHQSRFVVARKKLGHDD